MKNIICAIAKHEEKYIKDFCQYHLDLGFDEIHIYDNDPELPLSNMFKNISNVIIHEWINKSNISPQVSAYNDCIKNVEYDWCAFIDVDEFITLKNFDNIEEFLNMFDKQVMDIHLYERVYGDDGKIIPDDISIPVYNRILTPSKKYCNVFFKNIVKKFAPVKFKNSHIFDKKINIANSDGNIVTQFKTIGLPKDFVEGNAYIRHYKTKTLSEFCEQKLGLSRVFKPNKVRTLKYFTDVNNMTPEKEEYLKTNGITFDEK
jgi:hypothetical protein